jgi:hypothetical protein
MLDPSVSWLQSFVIVVVNFLVSWLYYSPGAPWFKAWALGVGMDPAKHEMTEADKKAISCLMSGALVGAAARLFFVLTRSLNTRFEGRKPKVLLINNCLYLEAYAVFADVLAVRK